MIVYFDTSAVIPLLVEEPTTGAVGRLWDSATRVVSVRLLYPEARAALAQAHRLGRLAKRQLSTTVTALEGPDAQLDHIEITAGLASRAAGALGIATANPA